MRLRKGEVAAQVTNGSWDDMNAANSAVFLSIPRNISLGYNRFCLSARSSTKCHNLPSNVTSTDLDILIKHAPELSDSTRSLKKVIEHANLSKIPDLLIVGASLLVVLSLTVNFLVIARIDASAPNKQLELFLLVFFLGISICVPLALPVGLSARVHAGVKSLGPAMMVQQGDMSEACLAILASGTVTVLITAINVLLM
jgi:hypothetical protein